MGNIQGDLAKVVKSLLFKFPFYGHFLLGVNKSEAKGLGTAGVRKEGINIGLVVDPEWWMTLEEKYKVGVFIHEVKHIAFMHLTMRDSYLDKELFNIAADLCINQDDLSTANLPPDSLFVDDFNKKFNLSLKEHEGTRYYYDELQKEEKKKNSKFCQARKNGAFGTLHVTWKDFDKLSDAEKKLIQKQIEYQVKELVSNNQKLRGLVPGSLKAFVDSLFEVKEPVMDWKAYFRRFLGSSQEVYTKKSRRKYNKRYADNPGLKIKQKKKVLFQVDTSGSMGDQDIKDAFHEIHHAYKSGTMIDIAEVDAQVHRVYPYKGKWDKTCCGRGGTMMSPGIEYFNKHHREYTTMIIFTDGYIESAENLVKPIGGKRILWVCSSNGKLEENLPGFKVQIKR